LALYCRHTLTIYNFNTRDPVPPPEKLKKKNIIKNIIGKLGCKLKQESRLITDTFQYTGKKFIIYRKTKNSVPHFIKNMAFVSVKFW